MLQVCIDALSLNRSGVLLSNYLFIIIIYLCVTCLRNTYVLKKKRFMPVLLVIDIEVMGSRF